MLIVSVNRVMIVLHSLQQYLGAMRYLQLLVDIFNHGSNCALLLSLDLVIIAITLIVYLLIMSNLEC
jgi:hypothetical protein